MAAPIHTPTGQTLGYARVSTIDQNLDRQLAAIGAVDRLFTEKQSGASRTSRTALADCLHYARQGDLLRVASLDRLARSLRDLHSLVDEFTGKGVTIVFLQESLTYTPAGRSPH